jgi:hypothetical protein
MNNTPSKLVITFLSTVLFTKFLNKITEWKSVTLK